MPSLRHYDALSTARFVTFSTYQRRRLLLHPIVAKAIVEQLASMRDRLHVAIHGYVIMPDHMHLVLTPPDCIRLGIEIGRLKAKVSQMAVDGLRKKGIPLTERVRRDKATSDFVALWQRRCYDHNCRTAEIVREKINYCHANPVKGGLVRDPIDWEYSSYRWYMGIRDVPLVIDDFHL